ncbi:DUF2057 family protein [Pectobacterium cacticida]|uniref:DUF2057 family protein n=1 Tax=Pectobacterium cacticida TaxID=69221 RepID=UPI002FF0A051
MKFSFITVCLFWAGIGAPTMAATTLKLNQKINLLMVDGQKISGSLLKGADSLELGNGQHQLLFNVVDTTDDKTGVPTSYFPSTFIATFSTEHITSVSFKLPSLQTRQERRRFAAHPQYQLFDEKNRLIPVRTDSFVIADDERCDLEQKMAEYNAAAKGAAVARFALTLAEPATW